ncbi:LacI family DNA-binding transcriptional regulator [Neorhizobium sp. NPDC001467]|uniref:LacI family DNA-binding transcriptional regulator n=1 Tax=Neorhizobium sp. NPDC001467 TaxID=3390595 RepID=UPI003D065A99
MSKRSTAQQVADVAGVSKWTVIRAFTPGASITNKSKAKVMEAAASLNYSPNLLARSLATNKTQQVAVLVDDFSNPQKLPFLETLTDQFQAEGIAVLLININRHFDHVDALLHADQRQVDAVILFGTAFRDETLPELRDGRALPPVFVLARDSQLADVPAIVCDAEHAIRVIVDHLHERGYRKPGFMTGAQVLSTALKRRQFYEEFWSRKGIATKAVISADRYSYQAGSDAFAEYFEATPASDRVDVLMCENDILAIGAMDEARGRRGLRVPEDLAFVGFDNFDLGGTEAFSLTTYEQPREHMVRTLIDMVMGRREIATMSLPGRLVVRRST